MDTSLTRPDSDLQVRPVLAIWGFFLLVALAIAALWFTERGFLFLLDFVWAPPRETLREVLQHPSLFGNIHRALIALLTLLLPTATVQKLVLAATFVVSGSAMTFLARRLLRDHLPAGAALSLPALTAGLFYALNPFVTTRVFMGQMDLLLAYALTPFAFLALWRFLNTPSRVRGLTAGLVATLVILTNAHHSVLIPLLLLPFVLLFLRRVSTASLVWFLLPLVLVVTLAFLGEQRAGVVQALDPRGPWARPLQAPYTNNLFLDAALLTATWKLDLPFAFPYQTVVGFPVLMTVLLATMGAGVLWLTASSRTVPLAVGLLIVGAVSMVLAIGIAHPLTAPLNAWLFSHVPFWTGMRDSVKFLSLLALTEGVLLAVGSAALTFGCRHARFPFGRLCRALPFVLLLSAVALGTPSLGGFQSQIRAQEYPESWYTWDAQLAQERTRPPFAKAPGGKARMLFLPWHQYLPFSFTDGRTVANPAPLFFDHAEVIAGDNSEVGGNGAPFIFSESRRPLSRRIEGALHAARRGVLFSDTMRTEGIRFVALATDTLDANDYRFLFDDPNLRLVFESPELTVWEGASE